MCGNGIRCVAKYVYDHGLTDKTTITVNTLSGIKTLKLTVEDGKVSKVRVDMESRNSFRRRFPSKHLSLAWRTIEGKRSWRSH